MAAGVDETIRRWAEKAEKTGELKGGRFWGKPFDFADGYLETPARIRLTHKILKNAGYLPVELELVRKLAERKEALAGCDDADEKQHLRQEIAELKEKVSFAIERANR